MNSENINYEYKGFIYKIFIVGMIILTILKLFYSSNSEFIFTSEIICFLISISVFLVSILRINKRDVGILKLVGVGYLFIAILKIISTQTLFIYNNDLIIIFNLLVIYIQLMNLCVSVIVYKAKLPIIIHWIFFFLILVMVSIVLINKRFFLKGFYNFSLTYTGIISNLLIGLFLFLNIIFLYKKCKLNKKYKWIIQASLFMLFSTIFIFCKLFFNIDLIYIILVSNLVSYFLVYNEFEGIVLKKIYSNTYENLNNEIEMKDSLNKSLIKKEKILKDTNILLEKSENKYYRLVQTLSNILLIFEDNILVDSIYFDKKNLKDSKKINYKEVKITLQNIVSRLTGEDYLNDKEIKNFNRNIKMKNREGVIGDYEIHLINLQDNRTIIVFNDLTEIIKRREEIIRIGKRIKEKELSDEFYSNISHELRTPINVIYSALQLNDIYLREGNSDDKINKNNSIIKQNCLRLNRTINNFIDSNKLTEGYLSLNINIYNIVDIIENVLEACSNYINLKESMYIYDPEYEEIYIKCDKEYIERVMLNILSNYIKYGKNNMIIDIIIKIEGDKILIEVINDAETIPEDKRKDIFEKFTKVDSSLSRPSEGSGLGLYLSKGLIELHKGEISILPRKEGGNIFRIVLPYDKDIKGENYLKRDREINELNHKVQIEFSDIYF